MLPDLSEWGWGWTLSEWGVPIDPGRPIVDVWSADSPSSFRVLYYRDEELLSHGEFAIPRSFFFLWVGWQAEYGTALRVCIDRGEPICDWVSVRRRPGGRSVSAAQLRKLGLPRLIRAAVERAGGRIDLQSGAFTPAVLLEADQREQFSRALGEGQRKPRRGKRLQDDELRQVADVYRSAFELGRPPTAAVQDEFRIAYPTAGRWVMEARRRGFLPPTTRGVAAAGPHNEEEEESDG